MNTLVSIIRQNLGRPLQYLKSTSQFHTLRGALPNTTSLNNQINNGLVASLLQPKVPNVLQVCGFKVRGVLKRRCKDCYIVVRDSRRYVLCPTHGRHKQMSLVKSFKNSIILTHATQSKIRPW